MTLREGKAVFWQHSSRQFFSQELMPLPTCRHWTVQALLLEGLPYAPPTSSVGRGMWCAETGNCWSCCMLVCNDSNYIAYAIRCRYISGSLNKSIDLAPRTPHLRTTPPLTASQADVAYFGQECLRGLRRFCALLLQSLCLLGLAVDFAKTEVFSLEKGVQVAGIQRSSTIPYLGLLDYISIDSWISPNGLQDELRLRLLSLCLPYLLSEQ